MDGENCDTGKATPAPGAQSDLRTRGRCRRPERKVNLSGRSSLAVHTFPKNTSNAITPTAGRGVTFPEGRPTWTPLPSLARSASPQPLSPGFFAPPSRLDPAVMEAMKAHGSLSSGALCPRWVKRNRVAEVRSSRPRIEPRLCAAASSSVLFSSPCQTSLRPWRKSAVIQRNRPAWARRCPHTRVPTCHRAHASCSAAGRQARADFRSSSSRFFRLIARGVWSWSHGQRVPRFPGFARRKQRNGRAPEAQRGLRLLRRQPGEATRFPFLILPSHSTVL